ncbi:unnamed protein product [Prorocentrum cordatum]|uniref:Sister chromatid cohesion protein n=1 Tax=Prorocentrum cordatum TaxID=2364126 RepID=A0ABN9X354_9DINO|nr:unnamed protein product [Polarella glacialis]
MLQSSKREPERKTERKAEDLEQPLVAKSEVPSSPWLGPAGAPEPLAAGDPKQAVAARAGAAAPGAAPALLSSRIVAAIQGTWAGAVREHAQEWSELCQRDLRKALLEVLEVVLELAGLPGSLQDADVDGDPQAFLQRLPEWVRIEGLDLQVWPLMPTAKHGKRSLMNFERFWTFAINAQAASTLLEGRVVATLSHWLLAMPRAVIRSLRHVSTAAALAIAEGLGHQHQALNRQHDTFKRQLESSGASNHRQKEQLQKNLQKASAQVEEMYRARTQLLEAIVPNRSRDVSEIIRLHTLCEVEKLMKQDPEMYLSNKWTARVFLMIHDPAVEVRLKAIQVIQSWYTGIQKSEEVRKHLNNFAQRGLSHLVERIADVDPRVAAAALRCLREPVLAESLEDEEFDRIVNLVVGSQDDSVREEAALFINSHVFQDPGICGHVLERRKAGRPKAGADGGGAEDGGEVGEGGESNRGPDAVRELYNSETSISMLVEYLENYVGDHLRISERVVAAFWSRAPALCHWGTMVNLCLVGESQCGASMDPVSPRQRLALLYIMEAAVRRAWEDFQQSERASQKEVAAAKLNDACAKIIPELPRLLEVCRPDAQHTLLFSHTCKILLDYAVDNTENRIIVNTRALCEGLRRAIESQAPQDTVKYCVDGLLALARCFEDARIAFLDLAKATHHECNNEIQNHDGSRTEKLRLVLGRLVVMGNRGIDMTFGSARGCRTARPPRSPPRLPRPPSLPSPCFFFRSRTYGRFVSCRPAATSPRAV